MEINFRHTWSFFPPRNISPKYLISQMTQVKSKPLGCVLCTEINLKATMSFLYKFIPIFTTEYFKLSVLYKGIIKNLQNEVFSCKNHAAIAMCLQTKKPAVARTVTARILKRLQMTFTCAAIVSHPHNRTNNPVKEVLPSTLKLGVKTVWKRFNSLS